MFLFYYYISANDKNICTHSKECVQPKPPEESPKGSRFFYIKGLAAFFIFLGTLLGAFFWKTGIFLYVFD